MREWDKETAPFVCYVSVMMLTVCVSLLGRGESTADEGTCWLWTKEWWRNGCQNLRYCCVFKCMFWVGGGGTMLKSTNPIAACIITSAVYPPHVNKHSLKCCIPGKLHAPTQTCSTILDSNQSSGLARCNERADEILLSEHMMTHLSNTLSKDDPCVQPHQRLL